MNGNQHSTKIQRFRNSFLQNHLFSSQISMAKHSTMQTTTPTRLITLPVCINTRSACPSTFSSLGIFPNHNIAMLDVTWNCVIYTFFSSASCSTLTVHFFLLSRQEISFPNHPRTWVIFSSRQQQHEEGKNEANEMVSGIFITHNTNFPCLASSNEIIDRYKK